MHLLTESLVLYEHSSLCIKYQQLQKNEPNYLFSNPNHPKLSLSDHADSSECLADDVSIIAGGTLTGWHADSAFVLWRRILGILGDVNNIRCPKIHAKVFSYLYELWHKLCKVRWRGKNNHHIYHFFHFMFFLITEIEHMLTDPGQSWDQCWQPVLSSPACLHPSNSNAGLLALSGINNTTDNIKKTTLTMKKFAKCHQGPKVRCKVIYSLVGTQHAD